MYACICAGVDENEIIAAVDNGADNLFAVVQATRAGSGCGSCHDRIETMIELRCGPCPLARQAVA